MLRSSSSERLFCSTNGVKRTSPPVTVSKINKKLEQYTQALEVHFHFIVLVVKPPQCCDTGDFQSFVAAVVFCSLPFFVRSPQRKTDRALRCWRTWQQPLNPSLPKKACLRAEKPGTRTSTLPHRWRFDPWSCSGIVWWSLNRVFLDFVTWKTGCRWFKSGRGRPNQSVGQRRWTWEPVQLTFHTSSKSQFDPECQEIMDFFFILNCESRTTSDHSFHFVLLLPHFELFPFSLLLAPTPPAPLHLLWISFSQFGTTMPPGGHSWFTPPNNQSEIYSVILCPKKKNQQGSVKNLNHQTI